MSLRKELVLKYVRMKFRILGWLSTRRAAEKAFELFCTPQTRTDGPLPAIFESAEKLEFPFEENTVRGYRWNHPSTRKALILHGFESSVVNFERYIQPLVEKGYEVLAFDAPAHGRSTGRTITVITYKNLIHYIWDRFGPIDSFITHSFGGLTLCLCLEELTPPDSTRTVLVAPAAETTTAVNHFFGLLELGRKVRSEFEQIIQEKGGKPLAWYSVARVAPKIRGQVLFLQDKDDDMTPLSDVQPIMDSHYPNFQFVISEGLGHRRIYRDDRIFKRIMEFL